MFRLIFSIFLFVVLPTMAQQPGVPAVAKPPVKPALPLMVKPTEKPPVLKALPLGGDDDVVSRPLPEDLPKPDAIIPKTEPAMPLAAEAQSSPLDTKPTGDDGLRLQIFLDEANFGPGIIDGKPGRFTELAVQSWNEVQGYPVEDWVAVNTAARKAVPNPLAVALVPDFVKEWVDPNLPTKVELQAKKKRMSYRSVAEFVSERYHCDVPYLVVLNGTQKINNLKARDSVIVPNITPFCIENLTGVKHEADAALSQRHVVVDTKINQARIFEATPAALVVAEPGSTTVTAVTRPNRGLVASFPITPGQPQFIKFGTWELRNMIEFPYWRYDKQLLDTGKRGTDSLNIPSGPNSPVGVIWNGLSKPGIGMHGTANPETIGRARSHGCIRLANWDAVRLPDLIRPGATVEIR